MSRSGGPGEGGEGLVDGAPRLVVEVVDGVLALAEGLRDHVEDHLAVLLHGHLRLARVEAREPREHSRPVPVELGDEALLLAGREGEVEDDVVAQGVEHLVEAPGPREADGLVPGVEHHDHVSDGGLHVAHAPDVRGDEVLAHGEEVHPEEGGPGVQAVQVHVGVHRVEHLAEGAGVRVGHEERRLAHRDAAVRRGVVHQELRHGPAGGRGDLEDDLAHREGGGAVVELVVGRELAEKARGHAQAEVRGKGLRRLLGLQQVKHAAAVAAATDAPAGQTQVGTRVAVPLRAAAEPRKGGGGLGRSPAALPRRRAVRGAGSPARLAFRTPQPQAQRHAGPALAH
mmetsp:Transcript_11184/g.33111  ORF Transcript_11184/g.33111 Transcript_11184/m.33111 type:complete len:342 (-) Transcript_11184:48-1073(-)